MSDTYELTFVTRPLPQQQARGDVAQPCAPAMRDVKLDPNREANTLVARLLSEHSIGDSDIDVMLKKLDALQGTLSKTK